MGMICSKTVESVAPDLYENVVTRLHQLPMETCSLYATVTFITQIMTWAEEFVRCRQEGRCGTIAKKYWRWCNDVPTKILEVWGWYMQSFRCSEFSDHPLWRAIFHPDSLREDLEPSCEGENLMDIAHGIMASFELILLASICGCWET